MDTIRQEDRGATGPFMVTINGAGHISQLPERTSEYKCFTSKCKQTQPKLREKKRGEIFVLILSIFYSFSAGAEKKGEEVG